MKYSHQQAQTLCRNAREILAITGAGISVASGLPEAEETFRGKRYKELFLREQAFRHWHEYKQLYTEMAGLWSKAAPNSAHFALARQGIRIVTINLDGLHQQAGTTQVIELHGSIRRKRCLKCYSVSPVNDSLKPDVRCPLCKGALWPDVVLEGEPVRGLISALNWLSVSDVLLVIGTSLKMRPIREFPNYAQQKGIPVIVINHDADKWLPFYLKDRGK